MTDTTYRVVFSGSPLPGTDRETAIHNFAQLFKKTPEQISGLFNGNPGVIKKGISQAEAEKYCRALEKAGVGAHAEPEAPPAADSILATPGPQDESQVAPVAAATEADAESDAEARSSRASSASSENDEHEQQHENADSAPGLMACPACGHEQAEADVCANCDAVIADFLQTEVEARQQPEQGNLWPDAPVAYEDGVSEVAAPPKPSFFAKLKGLFGRR